MPERVLSDEEARKLGLNEPKKERGLSDDEVKQLGLDKPQPERVAGPYGWEDPAKKGTLSDPHFFDRQAAKQENQNADMYGMLASGLHGVTGMEGPINGAIAAAQVPPINEKGPTGWDDLKKAYYNKKDKVQASNEQNLKDFPHAPIVGAVLSGLVGGAPSAGARLAMGVGQGALYGFGSSKHDLRDKDLMPLAKDTGIAGLFGGGGALVGEGLNAGAGVISKKLGDVLSKNKGVAQSSAEDIFSSARGKSGGETSSNMRIFESLENRLNDKTLPPEVHQQIAARLAEPDMQALKIQVINSQLGRSYDGAARQAAAKNAMAEAGQGLQPEAVEKVANARLNDSSALWRRIREMAPKLILPALGGWLGDAPGAAAGALAAAGLGRSGTVVKNAMADPYVTSRVLGAGVAGLKGGEAMSHAAPSVWERFVKQKDDEGSE